MALQKEITTDDGATATYWRIAGINSQFNGDKSHAHANVMGYASKDYRTKDKFVEQKFIGIDPDMKIAEVYEHLKTLPEFEGATDV